MTIEQLAEIGHNAERKFHGGLVTEWSKVPAVYTEGKKVFAAFIAREVLGPVTDEEWNRPLPTKISFRFIFDSILSHRLARLLGEGKPPNIGDELVSALTQGVADLKNGVPLKASQHVSGVRTTGTLANGEFNPDDAEIERVAKAIYDQQPVNPIKPEGPYNEDPYHDPSRAARWAARAAISAMRGKKWGIYMPKRDAWWGGTGGWSCYDREATDYLFRYLAANHPNEHYEVREYPSPPAVPDAAVEAGAMALAMSNRVTIPVGVSVMDAMKEVDPKPWMKHAELCLTAALPHLQKGAER